jgi:hypothetical protein
MLTLTSQNATAQIFLYGQQRAVCQHEFNNEKQV